MPASPDQILSVAEMRAAEEALISAGSSVEVLMDLAGRGAPEWVWRLAAHRPVTVLCGPGNNGGDGYVIAEALREKGGKVAVVAATKPKTAAAQSARALFKGDVLGPEARPHGDVLVDCLFGSGLTRPLSEEHFALLHHLASSHGHRIAIDLPSGVESDSGAALNDGLPEYAVTVALGAWKFAHFLMPACARMGLRRLVGIGVDAVTGAARMLDAPRLAMPDADAHKYRRGLLGVIAGAMPGATMLAASAAQRAGAGYVKLLSLETNQTLAADLVLDSAPLAQALDDKRLNALLIGPGLGRGDRARERLATALGAGTPTVVDADALIVLRPGDPKPAIATPHDGEMAVMERAFSPHSVGTKPERALALARASGMVVVAKGPDTVVAAPDGRLACGQRASPWLSTAGTGDVLAGIVASRLATGIDPFEAACQGVWLHGEAARHCQAPFTAADLAHAVSAAYATAL